MNSAKKIVFFDGDGTLWYPKSTKYTRHPVWVYKEHGDIPMDHIEIIPGVKEVLRKLKSKNIIIVILSTHPHAKEYGNSDLKVKIEHFGLTELIDEYHATEEVHAAKGIEMIRILQERRLHKSMALMVGDSLEWDYNPAVQNGIQAVLIKTDYAHERAKSIRRTIEKLEDISAYL